MILFLSLLYIVIREYTGNFSAIRIPDDGSYPVSGINRPEANDRRIQIVKSKTGKHTLVATYFQVKTEEMEMAITTGKKERKNKSGTIVGTSCKRSRKFARISNSGFATSPHLREKEENVRLADREARHKWRVTDEEEDSYTRWLYIYIYILLCSRYIVDALYAASVGTYERIFVRTEMDKHARVNKCRLDGWHGTTAR